MEYLRFLREQSNALGPSFVVIAILAGISNGILVGVIISSGNSVSDGSSAQFQQLVLFVASFLLFTLTRKHILDGTSKIVEEVIRKMRVRIVDMIPKTELPAFEAISATRIRQALAQDVQSMSEAAYSVTAAFASGILVVCAFIYIATLSLAACLLILGLLALGTLIYSRNYQASRHLLDSSWQAENLFFDYLSDQLEGFNELKVNHDKAYDLLDNDLRPMAYRSEELKLQISRSFNLNTIFGQSSFYAVMAFCIFVMPRILGDDLPVLQILSVVLFINGPIAEVIAAGPFLARANFAIKKLQSLENELRTVAQEIPEAEIELEPFQSLRGEAITYRYPPIEGQRHFQLGPLDFEIRRGEIVFLVGGNGTGKSTFLKLLCGLLPPSNGEFAINGRTITSSRLGFYRAYFSIILQDFRLFRRLLGIRKIDHGRVDDLLGMLRMRGVTGVDVNGRFTTTNLSTGQKKRLALLVVELDDREIYIFDEWAADQDPEFRKYFYENYLQDLRARGKTIIAATHDDHYFHVADRVVKMEDGQISSVTTYRPPEGASEAPLF